MKKSYNEPELLFMQMRNVDILTTSAVVDNEKTSGWATGDRMGRESWDAGY